MSSSFSFLWKYLVEILFPVAKLTEAYIFLSLFPHRPRLFVFFFPSFISFHFFFHCLTILFSIWTLIYASNYLRYSINLCTNIKFIDRANLLFILTLTMTDWFGLLIWSINWFSIVYWWNVQFFFHRLSDSFLRYYID